MSSANAIREQSRNCVVAKADSRHSVKRVGERGQPCLTPFEEGKAVDSVVPSADVKISSVRRAEIMAVVCSPMPNADSVASRVSRCMLSKACCKSMNAMWPSEPVDIHLRGVNSLGEKGGQKESKKSPKTEQRRSKKGRKRLLEGAENAI